MLLTLFLLKFSLKNRKKDDKKQEEKDKKPEEKKKLGKMDEIGDDLDFVNDIPMKKVCKVSFLFSFIFLF